MADTIEEAAAAVVAGELDNSDDAKAATTSAAFGPMHGGSDTQDSLHASSSTRPMGDTLHGGTDTQPLGAGWELPDDDEAFAKARAEAKASQAAAAESLRRFARGYVEPAGTVDGLGIPPHTKGQNHGR